VPRFNVYWRDPTLWARVKKAALQCFDAEGKQIAASDWLAQAAEEKLRRERPDLASDDEGKPNSS
jgi:hypothetical protein